MKWVFLNLISGLQQGHRIHNSAVNNQQKKLTNSSKYSSANDNEYSWWSNISSAFIHEFARYVRCISVSIKFIKAPNPNIGSFQIINSISFFVRMIFFEDSGHGLNLLLLSYIFELFKCHFTWSDTYQQNWVYRKYNKEITRNSQKKVISSFFFSLR